MFLCDHDIQQHQVLKMDGLFGKNAPYFLFKVVVIGQGLKMFDFNAGAGASAGNLAKRDVQSIKRSAGHQADDAPFRLAGQLCEV